MRSTFVMQYIPIRTLPTFQMDLISFKMFHCDSSPVMFNNLQTHNIYTTIIHIFTSRSHVLFHLYLFYIMNNYSSNYFQVFHSYINTNVT
jgi:hypothetical protein